MVLAEARLLWRALTLILLIMTPQHIDESWKARNEAYIKAFALTIPKGYVLLSPDMLEDHHLLAGHCYKDNLAKVISCADDMSSVTVLDEFNQPISYRVEWYGRQYGIPVIVCDC